MGLIMNNLKAFRALWQQYWMDCQKIVFSIVLFQSW